jgi:pimeloyl-ACP methyl ester carboxylesterase
MLHLNGIDVHHEVHGEGPPLLLIHGLGSCLEDWECQVPEFARQYRVITYDLRGHGRSGKPEGPYSMAQFGEDAAALLRALGVDSAHVVGISLGGGIAFQLVVSHPALVKSLVIVNSGPEAIFRSFRQRVGIWMRFAIVRLLGLPRMAQVLSGKLFVEAGQEQLRATFVERFSRNDKRAYLATMRAFIGWSVTPRIGAIRCPVLALSAESDYTPIELKEEYVAQIPGARLVVIPASHHALPLERPQAFNEALRHFLAEKP